MARSTKFLAHITMFLTSIQNPAHLFFFGEGGRGGGKIISYYNMLLSTRTIKSTYDDVIDYVNHSTCIEASQGFSVALLSPGKCLQVNFDMLPSTMEIDINFLDQNEDSYCKPCEGPSLLKFG